MRVWITEKKKNASEKLAKSERAEYIAEKKKAAEEAEQAPSAPEENQQPTTEKVEESPETQIDTTAKSEAPESKAKESDSDGESGSTKLTASDKHKIDERVDRKLTDQMTEIYAKIVEKASYLLKMEVP